MKRTIEITIDFNKVVIVGCIVLAFFLGLKWGGVGAIRPVVSLEGDSRKYIADLLEYYHDHRNIGIDKQAAAEAFILNASPVLKLPESMPQIVEKTITVPRVAEAKAEEPEVDKKEQEPTKKYMPRQRLIFRIPR